MSAAANAKLREQLGGTQAALRAKEAEFDALAQHLPHLGPVCCLGLVLGFEGGLAVLRRLQGRLMALLLVGQLLDQAVMLLSEGVKLGFLGAKGALGPTQLLPQFGIGRYRYGKEEKSNKNEVARKDPARLLNSRPESRGLHPVGALTRPHVR